MDWSRYERGGSTGRECSAIVATHWLVDSRRRSCTNRAGPQCHFVSAVLGDKSATSEIVSYAKSGKGFKMAKGGETDEGNFIYRNYYKGQGIKFQSEEDAKEFIKLSKPFLRKQLKEGNLVLMYNGKEYFIAEKVMIDDYYAKGGITEHGLKTGDKILSGKIIGTTIRVRNESLDEDARVDLNTGKRTLLTYDKKSKKWVEKMAQGGTTKRIKRMGC
jgi:hypothetical protein